MVERFFIPNRVHFEQSVSSFVLNQISVTEIDEMPKIMFDYGKFALLSRFSNCLFTDLLTLQKTITS